MNRAAPISYMFGGQVKVPMVIRMPQGAGHQLGPTHSHSFEALYLHVPGLLVAVPSHRRRTPRGCSRPPSATTTRSIFIEHETLYGRRGEVPDDGGRCASARPRSAARATT